MLGMELKNRQMQFLPAGMPEYRLHSSYCAKTANPTAPRSIPQKSYTEKLELLILDCPACGYCPKKGISYKCYVYYFLEQPFAVE